MKIRNNHTQEVFDVTEEQYNEILARQGKRFTIISRTEHAAPILEQPKDVTKAIEKKSKKENFDN